MGSNSEDLPDVRGLRVDTSAATTGKVEVTVEMYDRLKEKTQAKDKKIKEMEAKQNEMEAKQNGTFFSAQSEVFECVYERNAEPVELMRPEHLVDEITRYKAVTEPLKQLDQHKYVPAYRSSRGKAIWKNVHRMAHSLTPRALRKNNPHDFSYQDSNTSEYEKVNQDILGGLPGEVAHLLPHAAACAVFHGPTAANALGYDPNRLTENQIQILIHGAKKRGLLGSSRVKHSGLKHTYCNKCQLQSQETIFENSPYMLIIPCMPLTKVHEWKGAEYDVMVLIKDPPRYGKLLLYCEACEGGQVDDALRLLKDFAVGMAEMSKWERLNELKLPHADRRLRRQADDKLEALKKSREKMSLRGVPFLKRKDGIAIGGNVRVAKRRVSGPDPFLLAAKAAMNLFNQEELKLLPGCDTVCDHSAETSLDRWLPNVKPPTYIQVFTAETEEDDFSSSEISALDED